jgi:transcriptional antiterminator RfaH
MAVDDKNENWFLAQLKPNSAKIATKNLLRQGFKTFLPLREETLQRNGKFVTAMRPLFPGYIFVSIDVTHGLWRSVNSTNGITRLVSFGKEPAQVPLDLVSQIVRRCDTNGNVLPTTLLNPGDKVAISSGPFADFVAEIEKVEADQRVWILMEMMGSRTRVAVAHDQLRAL